MRADVTAAPRPELRDRLDTLLHQIRRDGGEWTTRRVQKLYRAGAAAAPLRATARKDLHALNAMGFLILHDEDPGRRFYTLNPAKDKA
ncbi:hypothetical protein ACFVTT_35450 [Streptomyces niveus]|uniref:hypothetical protein n=1 Tax=Streptomyces niveus TaxID=193462 RepID=UPI00343377F5